MTRTEMILRIGKEYHTANIEAADIQFLSFQLHISENVNKIVLLSIGGIVCAKQVDGQNEIYNVYVLTCYVTCDKNNKTFYAKDGKLYFKQTNEENNDKYSKRCWKNSYRRKWKSKIITRK